MTHADEMARLRRLAEFDRKRNQLLMEWAKARRSGRLLLYVDVRDGEVKEAGQVEVAKSWTSETT